MRDYLAPVLAAIQTPPHMPGTYFENAKNIFKNLEDIIAQAGTKGEKISEELDSVASNRFEDPVRELPSSMWRVVRDLGRSESWSTGEAISRRIHWLQENSKHRIPIERSLTSLTEVESNWGAYSKFLTEYVTFVKVYPDFFVALKEAERQDPEGAKEYQALAQELRIYRRSLNALYKYIVFYVKFSRKVQAFSHRGSMYVGVMGERERRKTFPPHRPIEVLYHAGVDIPAILAQGFKTRDELGEEKGALGGGPSDVISFTADIEIAKAIVDGIRDMVKIANGEMTFEDIEKLAQEEGLDPEIFKNVKQDYAPRERPPGYPDFVYTDDKYRTPKKLAFEAYRMALLPYSKIRYNPVFFGVRVENFENIKPESIGIVAAKVQMDQVSEYLEPMEEFRVPVSAILSVKRVLY